MLTVLEYAGALYVLVGVWFGVALAGQFIADALERRADPRGRGSRA
jgi:hypothetical protein